MHALVVGLVMLIIADLRGLWPRALSRPGAAATDAGLLTVLAILLVAKGYGDARQAATLVYALPVQARIGTVAGMAVAFLLLAAAVVPGNLRRHVRRPVRLAVFSWAVAHLLANGSSADLVLFGTIAVWSLAMLAFSRDTRARGTHARSAWPWDLAHVVIALLVMFVAMRWFHPLVVGVSPAIGMGAWH
jgi:uncharacterized membrane protein